MSPSDEQELHRISAMLAVLDQTLADSSPLREGLAKAGLALSIAFIDNRRRWIEDMYAHLDEPLSAEQMEKLLKLNIDPDS